MAPRGVEKQSTLTSRSIVYPSSVTCERVRTIGRVIKACRVALQCRPAGGGVRAAGGIAKERIQTDGRVVEAGCVGNERILTQCCIVAA